MLLYISLCLLAITILWMDLSRRKIHLFQLVLLAGLSLVHFFLVGGGAWMQVIQNLLWLALQFGLVYAYARLWKRRRLREMIGVGDGLFLLVVIPLFATPAYIIYYLSGLIFSLLASQVMMRFSNAPGFKVPLAGLMAFWIIPLYAFFRYTSLPLEYLP